MEPGSAPGAGPDQENPPVDPSWTPGIPSLKDLLPSLVFGAAVPIAVYFSVRPHVSTDAVGLIIAGSVSVAWILVQFARNRHVDFVGAVVLTGFVVGVVSSTLLGGNAYMLKVRDAFFTALFGIACVVTVYTHERPALFYVGRYLSAGNDPTKVAAYNELHEVPTARRVFRVLSVVWGIGLVIEASGRMVLAEALHTGTYIAVSPFITAITIGSLFAFTLIYTKRAELDAAALMTRTPFAEAAEPDVDAAGPLSAPLASHAPAGEGPLEGGGQPRPIE
ncbi:MAG TPA: VC0807 family protein [Acidimicrobiales bacterium]|nr:VC0807 family protein [Acidimicrobiales bacterium]